MRSHRLRPGQQTQIDVHFYTAIDGPGRHGEVVHVASSDPLLNRRQREGRILAPGFAFFITVDAPRSTTR